MKSQRGPSHPHGPRPNNRRHLLAVQEIFGRGRRWRFCGAKGSFGPSMSLFGQLESLCTSGQWLRVHRVWSGGHGIRSIIPRGGVQAGATPIPLEKCTSRTCGGSSLREDVPPVGVVDQNRQKSDRLADLLPLSTAVSEGLQSEWGGRLAVKQMLCGRWNKRVVPLREQTRFRRWGRFVGRAYAFRATS